jgi:uncharacterized LabA/DUF88 family protein
MLIRPNNYAFLDAQNLYRGVKSQGWEIDYRRFRRYLREKYYVEQAIVFIGYVRTNQRIYDYLVSCGFRLVFKPTVVIYEGTIETVKGNIDAELVLHAAAIEYKHYDQAVIVTGDGDFACLVEFLEEKGKLCRLLVPSKTYSRLLRKFRNKISGIGDFKDTIKARNVRSVD